MIALTTTRHIIILTLFLISSNAFAQNVFRLEILGGTSLNGSTSGVFNNWGNGWTVAAGGAYRLTRAIDLGANVSYHQYPYRGDNIFLVIPAIAGLRWSVGGQASNVIEGSISARISTSNSFINPYLSLRTGLYRINIGEVVVSEWFDSSPQNVSHSIYRGTGLSATKGFAGLGLGVSVPLDSSIRLIFEARYNETFDAEETFLPIQVAVQIDL